MSGKLSKMPRAEQWADRICTQMSNTTAAIIEIGTLLIKAKADIPHGEWERMFEQSLVPFGMRSAQRLMAVADHPVLSKTTHVSFLPPSWGTLYELTKVPEPVLSNAFKDGLITPAMERKQVMALLPPKPASGPERSPRSSRRVNGTTVVLPEPEPDPQEEDEDRFDPMTVVVKLTHAVRMLVASWPDHVNMEPLIRQLRHEADRLERHQQQRAS